jgi:hypothetical protein
MFADGRSKRCAAHFTISDLLHSPFFDRTIVYQVTIAIYNVFISFCIVFCDTFKYNGKAEEWVSRDIKKKSHA